MTWHATAPGIVDSGDRVVGLGSIDVSVDVALVKLTLKVSHVIIIFFHFGNSSMVSWWHLWSVSVLRSATDRSQ